jgi:predicted DCC family thiol-disulfide oxidoreductase YuxK
VPVTGVRERVERFFFSPASPANAGAMRLLLFSAVTAFALQENVAGDAATARVNWRPTSYFKVLGGPPSAGALRAIQVALIASAIFAAAGLFTRPAQVVATPLAAYLLGFDSNFGKINHRSMLVVLLLFAVLPARLGDGVSLDRLRAAARSRSGEPVAADPRYRWPVSLAQVCAVSVYLFAGLSKLWNGGPEWFAADSFRRFLYVRLDQLPSPPRAGLWLAAHPGWAQLTAVASVAFELSVVFVLVWPRLKLLVLPGLVVFHEATRALVRIDFTRTMIAALIPLVDYEAVGRRIRARSRKPRAVLLLDGRCDLCRRTGAVLQAMDVLDRVEIADARAPGVPERYGVDPAAAVASMHLAEKNGRITDGFDAYRRLSLMLPAAWLFAPALHAPGARASGRRLYARVARSRFPVLHCTSASCSIGDDPATAAAVSPVSGRSEPQ